MKILRLMIGFYDRSRFSTLILAIIMTLSLFAFSNAVGHYRYLVYTENMFKNSHLNNAVYFMPYQKTPDDNQVKALTPTIRSFKAVKSVVLTKFLVCDYDNVPHSVQLCDADLTRAFQLKLSSGSWFDQNNWNDAIVGGYFLDGVPVGKSFDLTLYGKGGKTKTLSVRNTGNLRFPSYVPQFGYGGTTVTANNFLSQADIILLQDTPELEKLLGTDVEVTVSPNFFVNFDENASASDRDACITYLQNHGTFATYDQILADTQKEISNKLRTSFPIPIFFLFISTISLLSVSVLTVYKKLNEHAVYYLCGCSRRKSFIVIAGGISLIGVVAFAVNAAIILNNRILSLKGILKFNDIVLDEWSVLYLLIYIVSVILLSLLIPFYLLKNFSPIETYRRLDK